VGTWPTTLVYFNDLSDVWLYFQLRESTDQIHNRLFIASPNSITFKTDVVWFVALLRDDTYTYLCTSAVIGRLDVSNGNY